MLKHLCIVIYRNALGFKSPFVINLIGLSSGLSAALLIYLWISDELSVDRYHENDDRLYQVMYHEKTGSEIKTTGQTPYFLSDALLNDFPEVEDAVTATPPLFFPDFTIYANEKYVKAVGKFVDRSFFQLFSYKLLEGRAQNVLNDEGSVVICESLARSLYDSPENAVGKEFEYSLLHLKKQLTVSGVFEDLPNNSSERFDFIVPFQIIDDLMGFQDHSYSWERTDPFYTYVLLKEGASVKSFNEKLKDYIALKNGSAPFSMFLRPFSDGYLYGKYENGHVQGGRIDYVIVFSIVAIFILVIACINFINLSTAKARTRLKEIGIKKVIGATRRSLILQFMGETLLVSLIALSVALGFVYFTLPDFNLIAGKNLEYKVDYSFVVTLVGLALTTGIIAGIYPALYISSFHPSVILKGWISRSFAELMVRRGLVVFQFALSIIFIISFIVIFKQLEYIQSKDPGYDRDNLLVFSADGKISGNPSVILSEIQGFHGVVNASSMFGSLTGEFSGLPGFIEYGGKRITMHGLGVNYDMLETLGVEIKEGRAFSRHLDHGADTLKWIFNEAAVKAIGDHDLVGKVVSDREIIGIAKDFHFQSFHEPMKPFAFRLEPSVCMNIWVKIRAGHEKATIDYLKKLYSKINPGFTFNYKFLDQAYEAQYVAEQRVAELSKYFALLAILISCLGAFGLAAFNTERRKKEISIRKVLGSGETEIMYLLLADFTKMVLIAIVLATPISYLTSHQWLIGFAYKIDLQWWYFIGSGFAALLIAWMSVGALTIKAAKANPVDGLRCE